MSLFTKEPAVSVQPLFTSVRMGNLELPNRIVVAPLTRMRAGSIDHVPTALQAEYYAQRASAGLIVAEATAISPDGFGWADTPGLWSAEQVRGWRRVTNAVIKRRRIELFEIVEIDLNTGDWQRQWKRPVTD